MSIDAVSTSETSRMYVPSMGEMPPVYQELWELHNSRPVGEELWSRVIALAEEEELTPAGRRGAYGDVPLVDLLTLAQKLNVEKSSMNRYALMLERSPIGVTWFDTLLGLSSPAVIDSIKNFLGTGRWQRGMDLGTGMGPLTVAMRTHCKNYVQVDQSVLNLRMIRSKYRKRTPVASSDALQLAFSASSFDLIVSTGLIGAFGRTQLNQFTKETYRVMKPGGNFISAFPVRPVGGFHTEERRSLANAKGILADMIVDIVNGTSAKPAQEQLSAKETMEVFQNNGFVLGLNGMDRVNNVYLFTFDRL